MRPRGCLKIFAVFVGLILICCIVGWFVGVPRLQDNIADGLSDSLSTQVAQQIDLPSLDAGTQTIDVAEIERQLQGNTDTQNVDNVQLSVSPDGADTSRGAIRLTFTSQDQEIGYEGSIFVEDGRLQVENLDATAGWLNWALPGDKLAGAIEGAVNRSFEEQNKRIENMRVGEDEITFDVVEG